MEIIYAIVKRNSENFYFECKPYETVVKLKRELINNFYAMEEKDMRLYLEKYDQGGNKYFIVIIPFLLEAYFHSSWRITSPSIRQISPTSAQFGLLRRKVWTALFYITPNLGEMGWEIVQEIDGTPKDELMKILNPDLGD